MASIYQIQAPWEAVQSEIEIMTHFKQSPFYSKTCNNEHPSIPLNDTGRSALICLVGQEYSIDQIASKPPELWIIKDEYRRSSSEVVLSKIYYCLHGVIYQAPPFTSLIDSRLSKASYHLEEALDALAEFKPTGAELDNGSILENISGKGQGLGQTALKEIEEMHASYMRTLLR
jgi:hypothetical protein